MTADEKIRAQLREALKTMAETGREVEGSLDGDLPRKKVVSLREQVEETANELLAVGCALADLEYEVS